MNRLELHTIKKSKVLSGREEGYQMRKTLKLDKRDNDDIEYEIVVPEVFSITASYFLACFGDSIRLLGKECFKKKYKFVFLSEKNQSLRNNIEAGIDSALNLDMPF